MNVVEIEMLKWMYGKTRKDKVRSEYIYIFDNWVSELVNVHLN